MLGPGTEPDPACINGPEARNAAGEALELPLEELSPQVTERASTQKVINIKRGCCTSAVRQPLLDFETGKHYSWYNATISGMVQMHSRVVTTLMALA